MNELKKEVIEYCKKIFSGGDELVIIKAIEYVDKIFNGEDPFYYACDTKYHNEEHTLMVIRCMVELLIRIEEHGVKRYNQIIELKKEDILVGVLGAIFHDTGYIRRKGKREKEENEEGVESGAVFGMSHEKRSVECFEVFGKKEGFSNLFIGRVSKVILATNLECFEKFLNESRYFKLYADIVLIQCIRTADILGQMGDEGYLEKLPLLLDEMRMGYKEAYKGELPYKNMDDFIRQSHDFVELVIEKVLKEKCESIYEYLNNPYPKGKNRYMEELKKHLKFVKNKYSLDS